MVPKQVDTKGRIVLDKRFAGATMLVERRKDGSFVIHPAVTVPANEAWLWKNKKALAMVQRGLEDARERRFVKPPDLAAGEELAAKIKD